VNDTSPRMERSLTLWEHVKAEFIAAHRRRPPSFYFLVLIPVVLLLGARIFQAPVSPHRFTMTLTLLLIFFWVVGAWAVNDFFMIWRKHRTEKRAAYMETLGNPEFMEQLGRCVKKQQERK